MIVARTNDLPASVLAVYAVDGPESVMMLSAALDEVRAAAVVASLIAPARTPVSGRAAS